MWNNHLFFDRVLSMGLRSAAQICQRVTNALAYMYRSLGFEIVNYLDDFAGAEEVEKSQKAFDELKVLLDCAGIVESGHKAVPPSTRMEFLGIICDTVSLTLEIPSNKLEDIFSILDVWLNKDKVKIRDIQSLVGKLNFIASCVRPGRLFMSRILNWLRSVYNNSGWIVVPKEVPKDLLWWQNFLPLYNGVSMMAIEEWSDPDVEASSDACLTGCGSWCDGEFFHKEFPEFIRNLNLHINSLELLAIVVCLKTWSSKLRYKRIKIFCDNFVSVQVINTGKSRNIFHQSCLREICFVAAVHDFEIRAVHISSCDNRISDYLSRWHLDLFYSKEFYAKMKDSFCLKEVTVSDDSFKFTHDW